MRNNNTNRGKQGFASMDPEKQREAARKGGENSHGHGGAKAPPPKGRDTGNPGR